MFRCARYIFNNVNILGTIWIVLTQLIVYLGMGYLYAFGLCYLQEYI